MRYYKSSYFYINLFSVRSNAAAILPLIRPYFLSGCAVFFVATLNSYKQITAVLYVCCDSDVIVARKVARKCENLHLVSLPDLVLIWHYKQCFSLSNVLICIIGHLTMALSVIDLARIIYLMCL